jgi:hypothetical protein
VLLRTPKETLNARRYASATAPSPLVAAWSLAPAVSFRRSMIDPTHQHLFNSDKSQYGEHTPNGT